jgi:hypothetical protein
LSSAGSPDNQRNSEEIIEETMSMRTLEQVKQITQAYSQTPWRKQLQGIVAFLLVVVSAAVVAGIYLGVTSQAATLGRQIQDMQINMEGSMRLDLTPEEEVDLFVVVPIEQIRIEIADLQGQLATNMSAAVMNEKAERMGFIQSNQDEMLYFKVAGYQGRPLARLAPPPEPVTISSTELAPAYQESLIDWVEHQVNLISRSWLPGKPEEVK